MGGKVGVRMLGKHKKGYCDFIHMKKNYSCGFFLFKKFKLKALKNHKHKSIY